MCVSLFLLAYNWNYQRRHWNNAVCGALDIVYCSVLRKCFGRYLLVPLLFIPERNGARWRIDYKLEK